MDTNTEKCGFCDGNRMVRPSKYSALRDRLIPCRHCNATGSKPVEPTTPAVAVPRDRLADMTRERNAWRRNAHVWTVACVLNMGMWMLPHIERAWLAWRAEPVRAQVQVPPSRIIYEHPTGKVRPQAWNDGTTIMSDTVPFEVRDGTGPRLLFSVDRGRHTSGTVHVGDNHIAMVTVPRGSVCFTAGIPSNSAVSSLVSGPTLVVYSVDAKRVAYDCYGGLP